MFNYEINVQFKFRMLDVDFLNGLLNLYVAQSFHTNV